MNAQQVKPIAILVADGFEEEQLTRAQKALLSAGRTPRLVGADGSLAHGWHEGAWGHHFMADEPLGDALSADFDALLVPGGEQGTASLRKSPHAKRLIRAFIDSDKPVALIGQAVVLLVEAEAAAGRTLTAAVTVRAELEQDGALPSDEAVVVDGRLITAAGIAGLSEVVERLIALTAPEVEAAA